MIEKIFKNSFATDSEWYKFKVDESIKVLDFLIDNLDLNLDNSNNHTKIIYINGKLSIKRTKIVRTKAYKHHIIIDS